MKLKTKPHTILTVTVEASSLFAVGAFLEKVFEAARAGNLDSEGGKVIAEVGFSDGLPQQNTTPLEALISSQNNPLGILCELDRSSVKRP
jgi:hypothetical protein